MKKEKQKKSKQIENIQQKEDEILEQIIQPEENFYKKSKKIKQSQEIEEDKQIQENVQIQQQNQQVWQDDQDKDLQIDISKVARLRKLRKNEEETTISGEEYQKRLQNFYQEKLYNQDFFKWGKNDEQDYSQYFENQEQEGMENFKNILKSDITFFQEQKYSGLQSGTIDISKIGRVLLSQKHDAVIQNIDFFQNSNVFLTCGLDQMIKLFEINIDEKFSKNRVNQIKSIYFEDMPFKKAQFLNTQKQILGCGLRKHLICYDLESEKVQKISSNFFTQRFKKQIDNFSISKQEDYIVLFDNTGYIQILSGKTKQFLFELKINDGCVLDAQFSTDQKYLYTSSSKGKIYQWDISTRKIVNVISDPGSIKTNSLAVSENYVCSGSDSSHVNVFQNSQQIKEIQNLTTSITKVQFNPTGELLCVYSKWKQNSIRLVHFPTLTVYQNWPNLQTKNRFISASAFSNDSKYLVLGNDDGNVNIYNLQHFN